MKDHLGPFPKIFKKLTPKSSLPPDETDDMDHVKRYSTEPVEEETTPPDCEARDANFTNGLVGAKLDANGDDDRLSPGSLSDSHNSGNNYLRWADDFMALVEDPDGYQLFMKYLQEENLGHILEFRTAVIGFKLKLDDIGEPEFDDYMRGEGGAIASVLWKRFLRHKNSTPRVDFVPEPVRLTLGNAVRQRAYKRDMFDAALHSASDFLTSKCLPNFVKSEIFVSYLQTNDISPASNAKDADAEGERRPASPPKASDASKAAMEAMLPFNALPVVSEDCNRSYINPSWAVAGSARPAGQAARQPAHCSGLAYIPEHDTRSQPRSAFSTLRQKKQAGAATMSYDMGFIDTMPAAYPAAPYHAMSSTVNNVTRQSSALQSTVTGGDASDTYSSFSEEPKKNERRQYLHERRQMRESVQNNRQTTGVAHLRKPMTSQQLSALEEHRRESTLAETDAQRFAEKLIHAIMEARKISEFKEQLRQNHSDRVSNPSRSVVGENLAETDESILDDHLDQVFNEEDQEDDNFQALKRSFSRPASQRVQADGKSTLSWTTSAASAKQHRRQAGSAAQNSARISHQMHGLSLHAGHAQQRPLPRPPTAQQWVLNQNSLHNSQQIYQARSHNGQWAGFNRPQQGFTEAKVQIRGEEIPYRVKIPRPAPITLADLKSHLPSRGNFRFYFKTRDSTGQPVFAEEWENGVNLPMWDGVIHVKCCAK